MSVMFWELFSELRNVQKNFTGFQLSKQLIVHLFLSIDNIVAHFYFYLCIALELLVLAL